MKEEGRGGEEERMRGEKGKGGRRERKGERGGEGRGEGRRGERKGEEGRIGEERITHQENGSSEGEGRPAHRASSSDGILRCDILYFIIVYYFPEIHRLGEIDDDSWLLGNIDQTGYYRVNYDLNNWRLLTQQLQTNHQVPVCLSARLSVCLTDWERLPACCS